jgi:hypothetical protein
VGEGFEILVGEKTGILTSLKASGKGEERGAPVFLACLPARILVRVLGVGRRCRRRLELKGRVRDRPARRLLTRRVAGEVHASVEVLQEAAYCVELLVG